MTRYKAEVITEVTYRWEFNVPDAEDNNDLDDDLRAYDMAESWDLREIVRIGGSREEWPQECKVTPVEGKHE